MGEKKKLQIEDLKHVSGGKWGENGAPGPTEEEWDQIWKYYNIWFFTEPGTYEEETAETEMKHFIHLMEWKYGPSEIDWDMYLT